MLKHLQPHIWTLIYSPKKCIGGTVYESFVGDLLMHSLWKISRCCIKLYIMKHQRKYITASHLVPRISEAWGWSGVQVMADQVNCSEAGQGGRKWRESFSLVKRSSRLSNSAGSTPPFSPPVPAFLQAQTMFKISLHIFLQTVFIIWNLLSHLKGM